MPIKKLEIWWCRIDAVYTEKKLYFSLYSFLTKFTEEDIKNHWYCKKALLRQIKGNKKITMNHIKIIKVEKIDQYGNVNY